MPDVLVIEIGLVGPPGRDGEGATWASLPGKPSSFPPAAHQHPWSDLTGIPAAFAPAEHTHAWGDITGKPATFAPAAHVHEIGDVTGLQAALDGKIGGDGSILQAVRITQAAYDALATKSTTTLYLIAG